MKLSINQKGGRLLMVMVLFSFGSVLSSPVLSAQEKFLQQNWSSEMRQKFYNTSQGSQFMPYSWFMALEQPNDQQAFIADGLARFGYLPSAVNKRNPDGLPVGFVKDTVGNDSWIGMNCAACHTNQIQFKTQSLQIDGGPTSADLFAFLGGLDKALKSTVNDADKFGRFATQVLKTNHDPKSVSELHNELKVFSKTWSEYVKNSSSAVPWGRARADAFGMIFNRVTAVDLGIPENNSIPNAPVSYPFLWGISKHEKVQWNGSAPNRSDIEKLGRNAGEVLGVFATTDLKRLGFGYKTSIRRFNLLELEHAVKKLKAPKWPEPILGKIDKVKSQAGQLLFTEHCASCHQKPASNKIVMTPLSEVKTDKMMAFNSCNKKSKTGRLEGAKLPGFKRLGAKVRSLDLTVHVTAGALLALPNENDKKDKKRIAESILKDLSWPYGLKKISNDLIESSSEIRHSLKEFIKNYDNQDDSCSEDSSLMAYKARPLDGIWATAPYLHNGSVANLDQLLLPAKDRIKSFHVGNPEFDPIGVGFQTTPSTNSTVFDTTKEGNSNAGHDSYGVFNEQQRQQLVEYMKSL